MGSWVMIFDVHFWPFVLVSSIYRCVFVSSFFFSFSHFVVQNYATSNYRPAWTRRSRTSIGSFSDCSLLSRKSSSRQILALTRIVNCELQGHADSRNGSFCDSRRSPPRHSQGLQSIPQTVQPHSYFQVSFAFTFCQALPEAILHC